MQFSVLLAVSAVPSPFYSKPSFLQVLNSLYDIAPVTPCVAVDLSHIPTAVKIKGFSGEDATPALHGADVVLISAGVARKPGMDRSDLFNVNAGIVRNLIEQVAKTCPKACIGIITNPVNTTVAIAAEVLKKPAFTTRTNCSA